MRAQLVGAAHDVLVPTRGVGSERRSSTTGRGGARTDAPLAFARPLEAPWPSGVIGGAPFGADPWSRTTSGVGAPLARLPLPLLLEWLAVDAVGESAAGAAVGARGDAPLWSVPASPLCCR
jgi:hypothetical protein